MLNDVTQFLARVYKLYCSDLLHGTLWMGGYLIIDFLICIWSHLFPNTHVYLNRSIYPRMQLFHYGDVIMGEMASRITSLTIVYLTVYWGADQRKHQSSASLAFVRGIHRWPVNSLHTWPVTRKKFPFDDVIMFFPSKCQTLGPPPHPANVTVTSSYNLSSNNRISKTNYFKYGDHEIENQISSLSQCFVNYVQTV